MKIIVCLVVALCGLNLLAADTAPKKKDAKKAPAAEQAKVSPKAEALAKTLTAAQKSKLLALLNEGSQEALTAVPGVGDTRAAAIKKARPYADVTGVLSVDGIGEGTFAEMITHAKAGFPQQSEAGKEGNAGKKKSPAKKKGA